MIYDYIGQYSEYKIKERNQRFQDSEDAELESFSENWQNMKF
jgi:hypothetical protein